MNIIFRQSHNWVRREYENKSKKSSFDELKRYTQEADKLFENLEGNDFKVTSVSDINQLRCLAHLLESMASYTSFLIISCLKLFYNLLIKSNNV